MFTYTHHDTDTTLETKSDAFAILDPRQDAVLDPHRFESVWAGIQQEIIFIKENMGLGREKALIIDENVEIFAAYVPSKYQRMIIYRGLSQHNAEHEQLISYSCDHVSAVLKNEAGSIVGIYALRYRNTLTVLHFMTAFVTKEDSKLGSMALKYVLNGLDSRIKIIYISEFSRADGLVEIFSALKFHIEETGDYNKISAWATVKDLKAVLQQYDCLSSGISLTVNKLEHYRQDFAIQKDLEACLKNRVAFEKQLKQFVLDFANLLGEEPNVDQEFELKSMNEQFMFLVKNEDKQIAGGILREIEGTQLHGKMLWLHESMRGKKLSEKLISLAGQYAKQKGCTDEDLLTCSYNAPWLFPKLGYTQASFFTAGPHTVYYYKRRL